MDLGVKIPVGVRFCPSEEELCYLLYCKILGLPLPSPIPIAEYDVYKEEPWFLPRFHGIGGYVKERYYFVHRMKKSKNGTRPNRQITVPKQGGGYWRANGKKDRKVIDPEGRVVGCKKSFVFCGPTTINDDNNWIMHEFSPDGPQGMFQEWVICKIYRKKEDVGLQYQEENMVGNEALENEEPVGLDGEPSVDMDVEESQMRKETAEAGTFEEEGLIDEYSMDEMDEQQIDSMLEQVTRAIHEVAQLHPMDNAPDQPDCTSHHHQQQQAASRTDPFDFSKPLTESDLDLEIWLYM